MELLKLLESMRTPAMSAFMAAVTHLGEEKPFLVLGLILYWCVSKQASLYVFTVGLAGTILNQWLKLLFRIPRPWVLDPNFTIVEAARKEATGYSFPSGHTQFSVGSCTSLALCFRNRPMRAVCLLAGILVPFSRLYLGVHTPMDVGFSVVAALILVFSLKPLFLPAGEQPLKGETSRSAHLALAGASLFSLCYLVWVSLKLYPADVDGANLFSGIKNAWTLSGASLGLLAAVAVDRRVLHFDVRAPFIGQVLKAVLGIVLTLGLTAVMKSLFASVFGDAVWPSFPRYFLTVFFAGAVWPRTFPFFSKIGGKK